MAPLKIPDIEIIANTEGAHHDSRAEIREMAEVRAHIVETLLDSSSVHNQNLKKNSKMSTWSYVHCIKIIPG